MPVETERRGADMNIELFGTIATILAVAGVILNNRKMIGCFYLWIVSNFLSGLIHYDARVWSLCIRDGIFIILAIEGIWQWGKRKALPRKG